MNLHSYAFLCQSKECKDASFVLHPDGTATCTGCCAQYSYIKGEDGSDWRMTKPSPDEADDDEDDD